MKVNLACIVTNYILERDLSLSYSKNLERAVRVAGENGLTTSDQLNRQEVNGLLKLLSRTKSKIFLHNFRRELLTVWNYAHDEGIAASAPDRIMKIRAVQPPVKAWSMEELSRMIREAAKDKTCSGGVHQPLVCHWLPCWVRIGYETAMRFSDIYSLTTANVSGNWVMTTALKTNKPITRPVSAETVRGIEKLAAIAGDGTLFSTLLTRRRAFTEWRRFLDRHNFTGSSKYLRRSCATHMESERPGSASVYLQHSSPSLVYKHYIDQTLSRQWEGPPQIN